MRYLLLAYRDERRWGALPDGERAALARACAESDGALAASGRLVVAAAPEPAGAATVRAERGGAAVVAGPVEAAREGLSALFIISARDLNEAIQVAAALPHARAGPIEVWPLLAAPG